jgi:hypothetical protein
MGFTFKVAFTVMVAVWAEVMTLLANIRSINKIFAFIPVQFVLDKFSELDCYWQ